MDNIDLIDFGTRQGIKDLRNRLSEEKADRDSAKRSLDKTMADLESSQIDLSNHEKARSVVQIVSQQTQKKVEYHMSNLVSMALASVFTKNPYEFVLRFVDRRNKREADIFFKKNGHEGEPEDLAGGGALDIAALGARVATWFIKPTNNFMALDEPGRNLSRDLQPLLSELIKRLSTDLKLQFLIISHIPEITESADRVYNVEDGEVKQILDYR